MVGDMNASSQEGSLTEPHDDFLEVHALVHVEYVCNEVDKTIVSNTPLELSYVADDTGAYDGYVDCTYGDDDNSGVLAPSHDQGLGLDKLSLDVELCKKDDKEGASFGKHD